MFAEVKVMLFKSFKSFRPSPSFFFLWARKHIDAYFF